MTTTVTKTDLYNTRDLNSSDVYYFLEHDPYDQRVSYYVREHQPVARSLSYQSTQHRQSA